MPTARETSGSLPCVAGCNKTPKAQKDNKLDFEEITVHLAQLEREAGNWPQAIRLVSSRPKSFAGPERAATAD